MNKLFKINENDNAAVALEPLKQGEIADGIKILDDIPFGHKVLLEDKNENENNCQHFHYRISCNCNLKFFYSKKKPINVKQLSY